MKRTLDINKYLELTHKGWKKNYIYWVNNEPYETSLYKKPSKPLISDERNKNTMLYYNKLDEKILNNLKIAENITTTTTLFADEISKINKKLKNKGLTIVPTRLFISNNGWAKMNIAVAKGKKIHDKREDLKTKEYFSSESSC